MRSRFYWALFAVVLAAAGDTIGQDKQPKDTKDPKEPKDVPAARATVYPVEIRFADDSTVKAALLDKSIEITTRYGKLTVPVDEIRSIEFGMRVPEDTAKRIEALIMQLGNEDYAKREAAGAELLELREMAFAPLQKAAKSADAEVSRRAKDVLKTLTETITSEKLHPPTHDTVVTLDFTVVGHVESASLKARTPYFGETSLKLAEVRAMRLSGNERETKVAVDAARYGLATEVWMDTGVKVRSGAALQVTASGTVKLRADADDTGIGLVGPDGRAGGFGRGGGFGGAAGGGFPGGGGRGGRGGAAGGGAPFRPQPTTNTPGALIGRVGEYGKVFVIGSQYDGTAGDEGKLYVRIVPSVGGNESSGSYEVHVTTGR